MGASRHESLVLACGEVVEGIIEDFLDGGTNVIGGRW